MGLEEIINSVINSKNYKSVSPVMVRRLAEIEIKKNKDPKSVIKAVKNKLHQVYGAYENKIDFDKLYRRLEEAYRGNENIRQIYEDILKMHSSTKERSPILENFYQPIFKITGQPSSILDLACGFNPLTIPWMTLSGNVRYFAYDIDEKEIEFLNKFFQLIRFSGQAKWQDIISEPPKEQADLALLLKSIPCLEQQQKGASLKLLEDLKVNYVVVSFPISSLSGRGKGMINNYEIFFLNLIKEKNWRIDKILFKTELVFVVKK